MNLFLDIETASGDISIIPPAFAREGRKGTKDAEKLIRQAEEAYARDVAKAALDPVTGRIVCIAWAVNNEEADVIESLDEAILLESLAHGIRSYPQDIDNIIGFNLSRFDLPYIRWRCMMNGIALPRPDLFGFGRKYNDRVIDLADMLTEYGHLTRWDGGQTMDFFAKLITRETDPSGITGADVPKLIEAGEIDKVVAHCMADVERVRSIYKRMTETAGIYEKTRSAL